jgi:hypothetical protein
MGSFLRDSIAGRLSSRGESQRRNISISIEAMDLLYRFISDYHLLLGNYNSYGNLENYMTLREVL